MINNMLSRLVLLVAFWYYVAAPPCCNSVVIGPCTVQGGKVYQVDLAGIELVHLDNNQQSTLQLLDAQLLLVLLKVQRPS